MSIESLKISKKGVPIFSIPSHDEGTPLQEAELATMALNPLKRLQCFEIMLTPQWAQRFLQANWRNRKVSWTRVRLYAGAILRGEWKQNGIPLLISASGWMVDGQHRCAAVIAANHAIPTVVIVGVDESCFDTIDTHGPRTIPDVLSISGEQSTYLLSATLRWLWKAENNQLLLTGIQPTSQQIRAVLHRHPNLPISLKLAKPGFLSLPPSLASYFHYVFYRISPHDADTFFELLGVAQKGLWPYRDTHPIYVLQKALPEYKARKDYLALMWLTMRAWNAFRTKQEQKTFLVAKWDRQSWPTLK